MSTRSFATRMDVKTIHWVEHSERTAPLFPLTPALSLGEREPRRELPVISPLASLANALATVLPLPEGEGRGEGEDNVRQTVAPNVWKLVFRP